ncbi:lysophospholipase L1-like esterase [Frankia casuarinae]|nr:MULTISPECIES: SGNH/GDSL hydrolase family protein [Frankia]KDA44102.1 lysophospholipase L1-like esterase [Frankia sp. BMG5.23]ETA02688.1 lysophospholipase L1-like esterase [Frankia sp. CcI6]EYT93074.1 lysophospholipase L1-like esterase [Frankia casuarinae]KEZ37884.1 lysophospholipase L1-like esterase [Frankia sp. CeD]KFB07030.1 lysophospholipase L1-like esterase [Frankia sp. Allo2]
MAAFLFAAVPITYGWNDPASAGPQPRTLAVLGDSYSSGEGNPPFDSLAPRCRRSSQAWPRLLGGMGSGVTVSLFAACSGATTGALHESFKGEKPQLAQLRALGRAPDVVTITIGGNDAGFGRVIFSCYAWRCFWDGNDRRERDLVTKELPGVLSANYTAVKAAAPHSRIIVVGYPYIFPDNQLNNICTWLTNRERRQLTRLNRQLDRVIRKAASDAGVEFVSTDRVLRGHEICTPDPWVAPVNLFGPTRDLSAHPTMHGQQAIAEAVQRHLAMDSW